MEEVPHLPNNNCSHHVYMTITDLDSKLYSYQTGRFPITSNCGYFYVVIFYAVDGNYLKAYPMKFHHRSQILKSCNDAFSLPRVCGYQPHLHKIDSKTSKEVENFIAEQQYKVQYIPANIYRTKISKRCCCTWKNHFTDVRSVSPPFSYGKMV